MDRLRAQTIQHPSTSPSPRPSARQRTGTGSVMPPTKRPSGLWLRNARSTTTAWRARPPGRRRARSSVTRTARPRRHGDPGPSTGTDQTPPAPAAAPGIWSARQEKSSTHRPSTRTTEITSSYSNRPVGTAQRRLRPSSVDRSGEVAWPDDAAPTGPPTRRRGRSRTCARRRRRRGRPTGRARPPHGWAGPTGPSRGSASRTHACAPSCRGRGSGDARSLRTALVPAREAAGEQPPARRRRRRCSRSSRQVVEARERLGQRRRDGDSQSTRSVERRGRPGRCGGAAPGHPGATGACRKNRWWRTGRLVVDRPEVPHPVRRAKLIQRPGRRRRPRHPRSSASGSR